MQVTFAERQIVSLTGTFALRKGSCDSFYHSIENFTLHHLPCIQALVAKIPASC